MRRFYLKNEFDILKKEDRFKLKDEYYFFLLGILLKGNMRVFLDNFIFDSFFYIYNVFFYG